MAEGIYSPRGALRSRRSGRGLWILLSGLVAVATVGLVTIGSSERKAANALWEGYRDELIAAGEPISSADIERLRPRVPPENDGFRIIEGLATELQAARERGTGIYIIDSEVELPAELSGLSGDILDRARMLLGDYDDLLSRLLALERIRAGRLSISFDFGKRNPLELILPSLTPCRTGARMLELRALVATVDNDAAGVISAIKATAGVAASLQNEPNMISRLVQLANDDIIIRSLERAVRGLELSDDQIQAGLAIVEFRLSAPSLKTAFQLERATFIAYCEGLAEGRWRWSDFDSRSELGLSFKHIRQNQLTGTKHYSNLVDAADDPLAILEATREGEADIRAKAASFGFSRQDVAIVTQFVPSFSRAVEIHLERVAALRCAKLGLLALQFRRSEGRLPKSLSELVPVYISELPADPFTNGPLRLATRDDGVAIYSVGSNGEDDGGNLARMSKGRKTIDVGFNLGTPP